MLNIFGKPLFVFEMANNHMGDVDHGVHLIEEIKKATEGFDFNFAFKMQYRQLGTMVHPDFTDRMDIKYIKRFTQTVLPRSHTQKLAAAIKANGFYSICTPFDNDSVDVIIEDQFDVLKVASCSFNDWPLLEKMAKAGKPIIASTAGADTPVIDNVVQFMSNRKLDFVLMHCIGEYPTPDQNLQMNQLDYLMKRYPEIQVGFSTHEAPDATLPIALAVAKGCRVFEKHVAVPTEKYEINAYSSTPDQVCAWLETAAKAFEMCGVAGRRIEPNPGEKAALMSLRRAVVLNRAVKAGELISDADVVFQIPTQEGSITANDWSKHVRFTATEDMEPGTFLLDSNTKAENTRAKVLDIVKRVGALIEDSNVVVPSGLSLEISHHYGLEKFDEVGISMLTVVNREYCKKLIVVLPGQLHPVQHHKVKEETFHVLYGEIEVDLDGVNSVMGPGSVVVIKPGVKHAFSSKSGAVIEEISTTHAVADSYYDDPKIAENKDRKTFIAHWRI